MCLRTTSLLAIAMVTGTSLVCFVGCEQEAGPKIPSEVSEFLLSAEPAGAQTPTEVEESFASSEVDTMPVIIAGRVGTPDASDAAFVPGEATFLMTQLPDDEHAKDDPDHASTCPFCKRKLANAPQVMVRFVDEQGNVLKQGAAEMLQIQNGDAVVIKGNAVFLEATKMIDVIAEGIYKRL